MTDRAMAYRLRKQAERVEQMLLTDAEDNETLRLVAADLRTKADELEKAE